jgi:glycosyltransferase involved in cell wall biosynthesis
MSPRLSVVICSLNGAAGVERCLHALTLQTISSSLEVIVVDDGSTDTTSEVGRAHGATVIRHTANRGLATARNSGLQVATAPVVAFLDDDCEPDSGWAEQLLTGYKEGVLGVGGAILPVTRAGFMLGYLQRNNPLIPQEISLAESDDIAYRLKLYLRRQWTQAEHWHSREVYAFAGANMSFRRRILIEVDGFDQRFSFGGEDLDICMRIRQAFPRGRLEFVPKAQVIHHFKPSLHDALRRSRAYGRGSARLYKIWPSVPPTVFPGPFAVAGALMLAKRHPMLGLTAIAIPHLLYPRGMRQAISNRSSISLLDAYLQLGQETCGNIGFMEGLWLFRHIAPDTRSGPRRSAGSRGGTGVT